MSQVFQRAQSFSGAFGQSSIAHEFMRKSKFGRGVGKLPMTPKRTPRGWYKGVGCRPLGRHTKKGKYIIVPARIPVYDIPDLTACELKPYVSWKTPKISVPPPRAPTQKEIEMFLESSSSSSSSKQENILLESKEQPQLT